MDPTGIGSITGSVLLNIFFKAFAIAFSGLYVLYAIVLTKQTQELNRTLIVQRSTFLFLVSLSQIVIGFLLLGLAIFVV